jgi:hypothetical protein
MAEFASVIAVSYKVGQPTIDVVVSILKGIDNAARNGNADFGLRVTLTYVSDASTVETIDPGRLSIATDTVLLSQLDNRLVTVKATLQIGTHRAPGANPSYSATAQLVHKDAATGNDDELGPAEQTFP